MENYYGSMWLFSGLNFDQNNWENVTQRPLELDIYPLPKVKFPSIISFQDMETNFFNKENLKAIQVYRETVPFLYSPNRDFKNKLPVDSVNKIISSKAVVFNKMNLIIESLKNEHPIKSRFLNKFSVLLLIVNQDLFAEKYYHQPPFAPIKSKSPKIKWIKIIWNISYSLSIFFGVLGSITLLFFSKNKVIKLLSLLSFYLLFIYVFSWLPEWRYILASLPFFIMTGGIFIEKIYLKIKTRDYSPTQSPSLSAIR
ncbi:MAG: hypothetical protein LCH67_14415 [Bacteroidetes bacterium]|nr:hypothetical protein [Bacteroidota bacterium]